MAVRVKLATLFSFIATVFLILVNAVSEYTTIGRQPILDTLPEELVKYLACFIILAILNYVIAGPVVKPLLLIVNKIDTVTRKNIETPVPFDGDEFRMLERGFKQITETIQRQDKQINHIHTELHQKNEDKSTLFRNSIAALVKAVNARDPYTASHSKNVMRYARAVSEKMHLPSDDIYSLEIGALLHDIGKIGVPEHVLMKAGNLTDSEFDAIRMHPVYGYQIINEIEELKYKGIQDVVLLHHERMDGNGYPKGLKGEEIPLHARIISVCDAFDAMTTSRTYRPALDVSTAIEQLKKHAGAQFDSKIVEVFVTCIEENPDLYQNESEVPDKMLASS